MRKIFLYLFIIITNLSYANDAVITGKGDTLFPIESSTIKMEKEVLTIVMPENYNEYMKVKVDFDFFNNGEIQDVIVGFVSPPQKFLGEGLAPPDIAGFTVTKNYAKLSWDISKIENSGFISNLTTYNGNDYVYYFNMQFPKGHTNIVHTYNYKGMLDAYEGQTILYRLTTGAMWAENTIEDFNAEIKVPDNSYLIINNKDMDIFNWKISGVGNIISKEYFTTFFIKHGSIKTKLKAFSPQSDIDIYYPGENFALMKYGKIDESKPGIDDIRFYLLFINTVDIKEEYFIPFLEGLNSEQLRNFRNLLFARKGYVFKDIQLQSLFENYIWYIKDEKQNNNISILNRSEKYIFNKILEFENKL